MKDQSILFKNNCMTLKNVLISLILIVAIGFAAWLSLLLYTPTNNRAPSVKTTLPDAYMQDVTAFIMDKQGRPKMKIITPKLVHYVNNDTTHLTSPQVTLYRKSPKPWVITSRYAKAIGGIESVDFWEDVIIHHAADTNNPATLIKTTTLTVFPNKQTAQTLSPIELIQPSILVKATGMLADMNTGDIKLLSAARGEYEPNP